MAKAITWYLDIDGVMRDLARFYELLHPDYPKITAYNTPAFSKVWLDHVSDPVRAAEMYVNAPLAPGAKEAYALIKKTAGRVTYLTANGKKEYPYLKNLTMDFLNKHSLIDKDDDIIFVDRSGEKAEHLASSPGVLFDDKAATIAGLPDGCTGVWVMNNMTGDIPVYLRKINNVRSYVIRTMSHVDQPLLDWILNP